MADNRFRPPATANVLLIFSHDIIALRVSSVPRVAVRFLFGIIGA
jgi:hypothetical protein